MTSTRTARRTRNPSSGRGARLEVRITTAQKTLIERAAAYQGRTVTDFVVSAIVSAAEAVIHEHEVIRLNAVESRQFVEALLHPPAPNAALRRAVRKYRKMVASE